MTNQRKSKMKDKGCTHDWLSESNHALLGYYCRNCGLEDWHNDHKGLRSSWMSWHVTFPFNHKLITFAGSLQK